ncbi:MAG: hypothetical protein KAS71_09405 [Bacteroidales bacterium]|nr:hypothetical protein [Bacteroidales bacterium]
MKQLALVIIILIFSQACNNSDSSNTDDQSGVQKVIVEEVLQTSQYTYLLTKQDNQDMWLAITRMNVETGSIYYYQDGLVMSNFKSQELDRIFDKIIFVDDLFSSPPTGMADTNSTELNHTGSVSAEKNEMSVSAAEGGISIADLYSQKNSYAGKRVKIRGTVVKFNPEIMEKNWIHLQDGTDFEGLFDLTVTSNLFVQVGDIVTFEGLITLEKDFGYGYFYDVIMEEGKIVK